MRRSLLLSFLLLPGTLTAQQSPVQAAPVQSAATASPTVDVARLTTALSAERRRAFMVGMQLTPAQDTAFWSVFEKFEGERRVVSERMVRMVQQYAQAYPNVSDVQSWELVGGVRRLFVLTAVYFATACLVYPFLPGMFEIGRAHV